MARKSLYDRAKEMIEFASRQENPEIQKLAMEFAENYCKADIKAEKPKLPASFLVTTIVLFVLVVGSATLVIKCIGIWGCLYVFAIVLAVLPFFIGAYLRIIGKIKETTFSVLYKEGYKNFLSLFKLKQS